MLWEQYRQSYYNFQRALSQVEILTLVSREVLREFPRNLPSRLGEPLAKALDDISKVLMQAAESARQSQTASTKYYVDMPADELASKLVTATLSLHVSVMLSKSDESSNVQVIVHEGFERLLSSQALIMLFAHVDAFMSETVQCICGVRPEILRTDKKIDWTTVLAFDSKEELMRHLTERYVYEFGWLNLPKRVEFLKKSPFSLNIACSESDIEMLEQAENIRHIAVHNGGKASHEYIERTRRTDLQIGEFVPVTFAFLDKVVGASRTLASSIFVPVARKFFDKDTSELQSVWNNDVLP